METSPTLCRDFVIEHILTPGKTRIQKLNEHGLYPYREMCTGSGRYTGRPRWGREVSGLRPAQQLEGKSPVRLGKSGASDLPVRRSAASLTILAHLFVFLRPTS